MQENRRAEIVLDIETFRHVSADMKKKILSNLEPPKNYKDEKKIAAWMEEAHKKALSRAALSPLTGRIVSIGVVMRLPQRFGIAANFTPWEKKEVFVAETAAQEIQILKDWDQFVQGTGYQPLLITFGGRDFDLPFMAQRAVANELELGWKIPVKRYNDWHIELRDFYPNGSLETICQAFLGRGKSGSGGDVEKLVEAKQWKKLASYNMDDCLLTGELWDRAKRVAGW